MLKTYEVIETTRPPSRFERPWWQTARLDEFETRIPQLSDQGLELLFIDVRRAVSNCGQTASDTSVDPGQRRKARTALRFYCAKRDVVRREMTLRGMFAREP